MGRPTVRRGGSVGHVFRISDDFSANSVVRRVVAARHYAERVKAWAAAETKRAERKEQFYLWKYGRDLEGWLDRQLSEPDQPGPARKSINLPAGLVGRRTRPSKLDVTDQDRALAWARTHCPDAIQTQEKLTMSALNAHFADTGELPDGTTLADAEDVFYIT